MPVPLQDLHGLLFAALVPLLVLLLAVLSDWLGPITSDIWSHPAAHRDLHA